MSTTTPTRQELVDAMEVRFATIQTPTYRTNLGSNVDTWRPGTQIITTAERPALVILDKEAIPQKDNFPYDEYNLMVDLIVAASTADQARSAVADLIEAIGVDPKWTVSGVEKAIDTTILGDSLDLNQEETRIAGIILSIQIHYRTGNYAN